VAASMALLAKPALAVRRVSMEASSRSLRRLSLLKTPKAKEILEFLRHLEF
jgi:hypothetical protein